MSSTSDETNARILLARAIRTLGSDSFPAALRRVIERVCAFDSIVVTRYSGAAPPRALYHDLDEVQAAISVRFYATGPYLLDPFYQASRDGAPPGVYRLFDLTNEGFFRSEYYRTFYRKVRIGDEIGILIQEDGTNRTVLSLARGVRKPRFTEDEAATLSADLPVLSALVSRHWMEEETQTMGDSEEAIEDRLDAFGADTLSPREAQIIRLVLQGHSSPSAAAFLGITEGTVKVHRHNAYSKLGVTSQAELFSKATRHLATRGN